MSYKILNTVLQDGYLNVLLKCFYQMLRSVNSIAERLKYWACDPHILNPAWVFVRIIEVSFGNSIFNPKIPDFSLYDMCTVYFSCYLSLSNHFETFFLSLLVYKLHVLEIA